MDNPFALAIFLTRRDGPKCFYCGEKIRGPGDNDHRVPLKRGGGHDCTSFYRRVCKSCNGTKNVRLPEELSEHPYLHRSAIEPEGPHYVVDIAEYRARAEAHESDSLCASCFGDKDPKDGYNTCETAG